MSTGSGAPPARRAAEAWGRGGGEEDEEEQEDDGDATINSVPMIPVEHMGNNTFEMRRGFEGDEEVQIAFKRVADNLQEEHFLNRAAVLVSETSADREARALTGNAFGRTSHVELIIRLNRYATVRFSIYRGTLDASGQLHPGFVHAKSLNIERLDDDYDVFSFNVDRKDQAIAIKFFEAQLGAHFNYVGYYSNFALPVLMQTGVRSFEISMLHEVPRSGWFCSELIHTALQAMLARDGRSRVYEWEASIATASPCASTPNSLFRVFSTAGDSRQTRAIRQTSNRGIVL